MQDEVMVKDGKKWEFDDEVAKCFDDMLQRSIPNYDDMRTLVYNIGKHFVKENTSIIDIGCSNGNAILPFVKSFTNHAVCIDVSDSMLDLCKRGFKKYKNVEVLNYDITQGLPDYRYSLILSILTIQFTPIEYRQRIIKSIYNGLESNGCFIFVEKLLGNSEDIDSIFVDEYYNIKREHSYTNEQIKNKRKSLEGVLVPITENWNIDLLKTAGFKKIDCFWRYLNFAGYIAIK